VKTACRISCLLVLIYLILGCETPLAPGDPTWSVIYDGNGATGGSVPEDAAKHKLGGLASVKDNSGLLTRTGYSFSGWNDAQDGSGVGFPPGSTFAMGSADKTLYAVWAADTSYSQKGLTAFSIQSPAATGVIDEAAKSIAVILPFGSSAASLVAVFQTTGASVAIDGAAQTSGTTQYDFFKPVTYSVTAADGTSADYKVTVTIASRADKSLSSFILTNPAVSCVIDEAEKSISATLPYGTGPTDLVAAFTTSGMDVKVGATSQASAVTKNDFSAPVSYVVRAADGTSATYVVTLTTAKNPAKRMTEFSFSTPPAVGVIDEVAKAISVTVPNGTSVATLMASFATTGASVSVGSIEQKSGATANDFTKAVTYTVTAADGSTQAYVVTVVSTLPVPTGLVARAGDETVSLSWDATDGATGYKVFYKSGSLATTSDTKAPASMINGTVATITGLTNGQGYACIVVATNVLGDGAASAVVTAVPIPARYKLTYKAGSKSTTDIMTDSQQQGLMTNGPKWGCFSLVADSEHAGNYVMNHDSSSMPGQFPNLMFVLGPVIQMTSLPVIYVPGQAVTLVFRARGMDVASGQHGIDINFQSMGLSQVRFQTMNGSGGGMGFMGGPTVPAGSSPDPAAWHTYRITLTFQPDTSVTVSVYIDEASTPLIQAVNFLSAPYRYSNWFILGNGSGSDESLFQLDYFIMMIDGQVYDPSAKSVKTIKSEIGWP